MKQESSGSKLTGVPLLCWDLAAMHLHDTFEKSNDLITLSNYRDRYRWNSNINDLLNTDYEALILTDPSQEILWVNPGFSTMTGYDSNFAIGKTPKFLQGPETDPVVKRRIADQLSLEKQEPFTEYLRNYRRTKELYNCKVTIIPLYDEQDSLVNYLALEKEVA